MKKTVGVVVCVIFLASLVLIPFSNADWTMFGAGPSHSNVGTGNPAVSPTLLWNYITRNEVWSSPAVVNGVVYIGSDDDNVYAINATDGNRLWNYTTGGVVRSSPAVVDGKVYIGSFDDNVYALNATNGAKFWNYSTGNCVYSSPAVVNGVVYVGSEDGNLYALNATDGTRFWNYTLSGVVSSPAVADGVVYIGSWEDGVIYALNATNGEKLWNYTTGGTYVWSSPVVVNGIVYGVYGGSVEQGIAYALNATNGAEIWSYSTGTDVEGSPAVFNGVVYIASLSGNVYALDASNGAKLWSCVTLGNIDASPVVAGNAVYVGGENGYFYALDASSGAQLWNYTKFGVVSSSAVVDGVVYLGSDSNNVYALGSSVAPSPSPTPNPTSTYPSITLDPSMGPAGTGVVAKLSGFTPYVSIIIAFSTTNVGTLTSTSGNGSVQFTVPQVSLGWYNVTATDPSGDFATAYFIVAQATTLPTPTPIPTSTPTPSPTPVPTPTPTPAPKLPSPNLSFECISSTTSSGFNVQIQGSLTYNGVGVSDAGIQLSDSVTGGATWQDLTYLSTDNNGTFICVWNPPVSGNYCIEATWPGDSDYSSASAVYNFAVVPFDNQAQNVFSVTSNSTLTSLTFDSATNELSFGVSGPSGTTGLTKVCIPQSLIPDISKINVMLDGSTINYTSVSEGNVWLIAFTYHHSSHTIVIALGSSTSTVPECPWLWAILTLLIAVSVSFTIAVSRWSRQGSHKIRSPITRLNQLHRQF